MLGDDSRVSNSIYVFPNFIGWRIDLVKNLIWFAVDGICPLKFIFMVSSLAFPSNS
jgi:hypothetical protein